MRYHPNRMHRGTPLNSAKTQRISCSWPVSRQPAADNQRETKRVESWLVRCLDGGSSPPSSTIRIVNQYKRPKLGIIAKIVGNITQNKKSRLKYESAFFNSYTPVSLIYTDNISWTSGGTVLRPFSSSLLYLKTYNACRKSL